MGTVGLSRCMQSHRSVAQTRKMFQSVVSVPLLVLVVALSAPLCQPRPQLDFLTNMLGNTVEAVSSVLKDYDTAPYTVITTHPGGVEEREYPAMSWVCHQRTKSEGRNGMFMSLFRYITGANADSAKIDMTTPVTTLNVQVGTLTGRARITALMTLALQLLNRLTGRVITAIILMSVTDLLI